MILGMWTGNGAILIYRKMGKGGSYIMLDKKNMRGPNSTSSQVRIRYIRSILLMVCSYEKISFGCYTELHDFLY
jgi:hypothetical protein